MKKEIDLKKIKSQLRYGDQKVIAELSDCSIELVKKVLNGQRNYYKGKGKDVIENALKVIDRRGLLIDLLNQSDHK